MAKFRHPHSHPLPHSRSPKPAVCGEIPFAAHPSTLAESVASPPVENIASLPESLPEMTATKVPIGLLVIYEGMSWPPVPAPRKCPPVPAPWQRPPEPAPRQHPPVAASPGPVPQESALSERPPEPAPPERPQEPAPPVCPQVPDRAPIYPKEFFLGG